MPPTFLSFKIARTQSCQPRRAISHIALMAAGLLMAFPCLAQVAETNASPNNPPKAANTVNDLLAASSQFLASGDFDSAVTQASVAIQLDPHSAAAYEQRGSIYIQEKLWDRAERDYSSADHISPDVAYKYKLAEIKFLQRMFDDARIRFARLEADERLGDLATFKVFLCDQLGDHPAAAARDLSQFDGTAPKPSYYYCHVIWDYFHEATDAGNKLRSAAVREYGNSIDDLYLSSLSELKVFRPYSASFVTRNGTSFNHATVYLETDGLRALSPQGWITLPLAQLPDDLSPFPEDLREQITKKRASVSATTPPGQLVSFMTRAGKSYSDVRCSLADDGLSVLSPDGWTTIPFAQLPVDLSAFPPDLQQSIHLKMESKTPATSDISLVRFTTKLGKRYDLVRASLADHGLRLLTADGWITVPFAILPDDLLAFPPEWRSHIQAKRNIAPDDDRELKVVSFKTRKGKQYTEVRAALEKNGMHLLTSEGWIAVPFDQLPVDLSVFPEEWQKMISEQLVKSQINETKK